MAEVDMHEKYCMLAEWFDFESFTRKKFYLSYFLSDDTVELYDVKNHRVFLRRTKVEGIKKSDIYIGNTIKIFSRTFSILDYANEHTMKMMSVVTQKTCGIIKPEAVKKKGEILKRLIEEGFKVSKLKMLKLSRSMAEEFFISQKESRDYSSMVNSLSSGPVIVMELLGDLGLSKLLELAGPDDPAQARQSAPHSLRALCGIDKVHNGFHATAMNGDANHEIKLLLETDLSNCNYDPCTAVFDNSTLCIIKPHAIRDGHLGEIVNMIEENGYSITAMKMANIDVVNAEEFYEVYKGIAPEYSGMVGELVSGVYVALEVTSPLKGETAVKFRKYVGPTDPEIAKQLRPNTLRAMFGVTKLQNGVHVTDLPEDALLEVEYFFKILD